MAGEKGAIRSAHVCGACFNGAIHLVPTVTTMVRELAETTAKRRESKEIMGAATKKIRRLAKAYAFQRGAGDWEKGRSEGREQAADMLDAGDY